MQSTLEARNSIHHNSRTFSLASAFFTDEQQLAASHIYFWCRYCDDLFDGGGATKETLEEVRAKTIAAMSDFKNGETGPYASLSGVAKKYQVPLNYPLELLQGMGMDLEIKAYETVHDLQLYCYRVAGTVGLMMCHVMGVYHTDALSFAARLGMAMQLTNICRDVKADAELGRVYLPKELLLSAPPGIDPRFHAVKILLQEAEILYHDGLRGVKFLPLKSALAVMIAGRLYREIGRSILRKGPVALESRTVVGLFRKLIIIFSSLLFISLIFCRRFFTNQKTVPIDKIWKYS